MFFSGFGGFDCCWQGSLEHPLPSGHQFLIWLFLVVLVVLAVAGRAPWGTPYHHILILFGGFGGFGRRCPLPFPQGALSHFPWYPLPPPIRFPTVSRRCPVPFLQGASSSESCLAIRKASRGKQRKGGVVRREPCPGVQSSLGS